MLLFTTIHAQLSNSDSIALHQSILSARQNYTEAINGNSQVYNGQEYISRIQQKKVIGDPFYFDYDWQEGSVYYHDQLYENVSLRYNLFEDKLLLEYSQGYESIELIAERIKYFVINDHTFVQLSPALLASISEEGFFDFLYNGPSKLLAKRYKVIKEIADQGTMTVEYIDKTKLFLQHDGKFIPIHTKRDALNAFSEHKTELKKFLSQKKIHFKSNPELALVAMATFNDRLMR